DLFFSSRRRHTRSDRDWSSDVCSSDLVSDASGASAFPPVGTVNFSTSGGGSFAPSSCTLSSSIGNSSTCSVTYNTSAGGSQTIKIGRASCRERVETPDVAVLLNKKSDV